MLPPASFCGCHFRGSGGPEFVVLRERRLESDRPRGGPHGERGAAAEAEPAEGAGAGDGSVGEGAGAAAGDGEAHALGVRLAARVHRCGGGEAGGRLGGGGSGEGGGAEGGTGGGESGGGSDATSPRGPASCWTDAGAWTVAEPRAANRWGDSWDYGGGCVPF